MHGGRLGISRQFSAIGWFSGLEMFTFATRMLCAFFRLLKWWLLCLLLAVFDDSNTCRNARLQWSAARGERQRENEKRERLRCQVALALQTEFAEGWSIDLICVAMSVK